MTKYEKSWLVGFDDSLLKDFPVMALDKKQVQLVARVSHDPRVVYSHVMGLMNPHDICMEEVFQHEVTPIQTSMFEDSVTNVNHKK